MVETTPVASLMTLLLVGCSGLYLHQRRRIARRMGVVWPPQGPPGPMGKPTWSGDWFARRSIGGALALTAIVGAGMILTTRPNYGVAALVLVPQFLIGTFVAIRALLSGDGSGASGSQNEGEGGTEGRATGGR